MSEVGENWLPYPEMGGDYHSIWQGLANQEIRKNTILLLNREGIGADTKEFRLEMDIPHQLMHLLRVRARRDSYNGIVADILTIAKGCQAKFVVTLIPESDEDGKRQPASLSYGFVSKVSNRAVGSYNLVLQEGKPPKIEFQAKRGLGYKKIPKWVFRMEGVGNRDFEIIMDTLDFIVAKDSNTLFKKEYIEHQRQIRGDRLYIDEYSQEARDIEAQARAQLLEDWPRSVLHDLD